MKRHLITAVAALCGIALASCSDSANDDNAKLMLAMQSSKASASEDTTGYKTTAHTYLAMQYLDVYFLKSESFSTDIENLSGKTSFKGDGSLDYDEIVVHDASNTASVHKATYYLFNQVVAPTDFNDETGNIIGKGVYDRDSVKKEKTLKEYIFDSPLKKAEADAYTGTAKFAYYESFADEALTKTTCRCVYKPSDNNEIDTWTTVSYYTPTGTGDLKVEDSINYLPFNLKWDETQKKGVAIDSSLLTADGKVVFKNYKGDEQDPVDFPVKEEQYVAYKKSTSGNPYDFELCKHYDFQRIHAVTTNSTDRYQLSDVDYYRYDFEWNTSICPDSFIEQMCWNIKSFGSEAIDIENPSTFTYGTRSSTVIKDYGKFGNNALITRLTWLNPEFKTNYYRTFDYEGVTKADGTKSSTEYYEYMYRYFISDSSSDYPTHEALYREAHQDYVNGLNIYSVRGYSNESSYKGDSFYSDTSDNSDVKVEITAEGRRSITAVASRPSFANSLGKLKLGYSERY